MVVVLEMMGLGDQNLRTTTRSMERRRRGKQGKVVREMS